MDYEGADAMVEDPSQASEKARPSSKQSAVKEEEDKEEVESAEESEVDGSDDDFVEEAENKRARLGKVSTYYQ